MAFNPEQPSFKRMRDHYSELRRPIVFWVGAGLSTDAGAPLWGRLRSDLVGAAMETIKGYEPGKALEAEGKIERASVEDNLWDAFQIIKKTIGDTEFRETIRSIFASFDSLSPPAIYQILWGLKNIQGVLSFNIDGFANRAHRIMRPHEDIISFHGSQTNDYIATISSGKPFIGNLHGTKESYSSWVFTRDDISSLVNNNAYRTFIDFIFTSMTVIFVGISADDLAAGGFLERLTTLGLDVGPHFWVTHRRDEAAFTWSSRNGVQVVHYDPDRDVRGKINHSIVLGEIFENIDQYVSYDGRPPVIIPKLTDQFEIPTSAELRQKSEDDIRIILAGEAKRIILNNNNNTDSDEYRNFLRVYSPNIYQSWHITNQEPYNYFFGYKVVERISYSAFSSVWRLHDKSGSSYALKVILIDKLEAGPQIDSFRRGVQSLRYITNADVPSALKLIEAYEIPSSVLMTFIEGRNLQNIVKSSGYFFWRDGLNIAINFCRLLQYSHNLPQGVLHRDIRPSNIMVPDYDWPDIDAIDNRVDRYKAVILNYDMSWHIDAKGHTIAGNLDEAGYYPPELLEKSKENLARRATVDSYGVGMTLFYMFCKINPPSGGSKSTDWKELLSQKFRTDSALVWHSAPHRLRRIIADATNPHDADRTTVSTVLRRIESLRSAVQGKSDAIPLDMWAEELTCRSVSSIYSSNDNENEYKHEPIPGRMTIFKANFRSNSVEIRFMNTGTEATDRTRAGKVWGEKLKAAQQILTAAGLAIGQETTSRSMQIVLTASVPVELLKDDIAKIASAVAHGLNQVRLA